MAAEPARQPAPTVGRSLGMAVGLCASPCVFGVYYDSPYNPYRSVPIAVVGLAGLAAAVILGLVAARLARWPRLGPAAVGLLASVAPAVYVGLQAAALAPSNASAAITIGSLVSLVIGGTAGLVAGIMARGARRRTPWPYHAGLGLAIGASIGLYLSSIVFMPFVANARPINLLVGGAVGLAVGFAAAWGGDNRHGRVGLGLAVGCCMGIWAYHVVFSIDGLFGLWGVWTVWAALGGAAGLAWAGRSGGGRLRPAAAGLAVGACTGASFGLFTCLSTGCSGEGSGISRWGLIGSLAGGVLGVAIGALGYRTRLGSAAFGLAIGAVVSDSAFIFNNSGTFYQGRLDASELGWHVIVGVFGLVVGWFAAGAGERLAAFGLGFGGWMGAWAGAMAVHYAIVPGGADQGGIVGMLVGGLVGLVIAQRAGRLPSGSTALGVAIGAFLGARLADPDGQSAARGVAGMIVG